MTLSNWYDHFLLTENESYSKKIIFSIGEIIFNDNSLTFKDSFCELRICYSIDGICSVEIISTLFLYNCV